MTGPSRDRLIESLLTGYGRTYAEELGIDLGRNTPSVLFRWLCASLLLSARIRAENALRAARALFQQGWTTPRKMLDAGWERRTMVLNRSGYARYDGITSRMLGDTAALLLEKYGGDLRKLREAAGRDPEREHELLQEFKGIGKVGADIFCREMQAVWPELYPFLGARAERSAAKLGLETDPQALARRVAQADFPRLVAALIRVDLAHAHDSLVDECASRGQPDPAW